MTSHFDMGATIAPKSDQLNADDLIAGPRTITVTRVSGNDNAEQPVNVFFDGDAGKPFRPCKSMRRVMVAVWGADAKEYVGRSMTIYRDPNVQFGGMQVGGIRISHMTHIDKPVTMALTATRAKRAAYRVEPLLMREPAPATVSVDLIAAGEAAARNGRDAFVAFWNSDAARAHRDALKPELPRFQEIATKADEAAEQDPFGLPPVEPTPTPAEREAAMVAASEAAHSQENDQ
jgi:hypothetical protein